MGNHIGGERPDSTVSHEADSAEPEGSVTASRDGAVLRITLDRPARRNSLTGLMIEMLVGVARARRMLLLAEKVSATDAADWGLIHQAVGTAELDDMAEELLARLASGPTVAIGLAKQALSFGQHATLSQSMTQELYNVELACRTNDFKEGLEAFRQRRAPKFQGR